MVKERAAESKTATFGSLQSVLLFLNVSRKTAKSID
jgi:hypothetical protein